VRYPTSSGFKTRSTSSVAARRIAPRAMALRDRVFDFPKANYPAAFTADEVADRLRVSMRPRMSELHRSALIEPSGARRFNASGMFASCWRAVLSSGGGA
jgi:hypothetical protein